MTLLAPAAAVATADSMAAEDWRSVVSRFELVAASYPDRVALVGEGMTMSYGELAARSAAVAAGLAARGAGAESLVGLLLPRGADLVVGLLGILRSGASYLPLDPALPVGRLHYMCDAARPLLLLSDRSHRRRVPPALGRQILTLETCARAAAGGSPRSAGILPAHRAYAIFTSGSTGRPKAVEVTHGSLAALHDGLATVVGPGPARVGWNASPSFDASVQQWLRLCRGDTVVLVGDQVRTDPEALAACVREERLDEMDITPSHLVSLLEHLPAERRDRPLRLLVGGEAVSHDLWRRLGRLRDARTVAAVNLYGPTECTVDATCTQIEGTDAPHLGDPLPGTQVRLLDDSLQPVLPGGAGELYLAGTGVSRGYLGMPGLTAQRFVADIGASDGSRMYRTGDRARLREDGRLEYIGRTDDQVKLRGYRVELGEVEAVLSRCPGVVQAVAVVRDDAPGGAGLVGYCRPGKEPSGATPRLDVEAVRRTAAEHLPDYMVPNLLVPVESFPLTGNGKVDRDALPPPVRTAPAAGDDVELRTTTERLVAAVWCELLEVDRIGREESFFEAGGQSALAIRMVAQLRRKVGGAIPLVAVFKHPVLHDLAKYLDEQGDGHAAGGQDSPV